MDKFWSKIAILAILVVGLIVLVKNFSSPKRQPEEPSKTFRQTAEEDRKRLTAPIEPATPPPPTQPEKTAAVEQQAKEPVKIPIIEPVKPRFEPLSFEEEIEAQRLFEWVINQRQMGRLPVLGYKKMVDACREIIKRWPQSEYAAKARRAMGDIPQGYWKRYGITEEEVNPSS